MLRMADSASAARRSTRTSQQPLSLAEEQAASALSLLEQRDIAAALRLSLHDSWDSDDEADSSSIEEEEEKAVAAPAEEEAEWTSDLHDICHVSAMSSSVIFPTALHSSCCSASCLAASCRSSHTTRILLRRMTGDPPLLKS